MVFMDEQNRVYTSNGRLFWGGRIMAMENLMLKALWWTDGPEQSRDCRQAWRGAGAFFYLEFNKRIVSLNHT